MPLRFPFPFVLVCVLAATLAMSRGGARAADGPEILVSPATTTVNVGDDVSLDIEAANVPVSPGLGGYLVSLQWNPAVLQLTSITDAGWVTNGNIIDSCETTSIDNAAGTAAFDCTPALAFGPGVSTTEPRVMARAIFHATATGTTAIDLTGSTLINPSNIVIASTITGSSVTVAAAQPSSTPSPKATATAQPTGTPDPTATSPSISATPSTNPTAGALSRVEVPQTGSGTTARSDSGMTWWMTALVAAAALLGVGGFAALRRASRRTDDR